MGDVIFRAEQLTYRYPGVAEPAVCDVDFHVAEGELVGIIGPNGSGKTTLLRLLLGVLKPNGGRATAFDRPASEWRRPQFARMVGVVVQREEPVFPLRVRQAVMLGRYPHAGAFGALTARDAAIVKTALADADALHLAERWTATLSAGEWQRVRLARALAQEPRVLVLDEPTANLDIRHEMEVFELAATFVGERGLTGVLVTHHVNLATRYFDRVVIMNRGRVAAAGPPATALTRAVLETVFEWPVDAHPWRGIPQFVPLRKNEIT